MPYVPPTPDPKYPHRPTHPDFALLSAISQDLDGDITGTSRYPGDVMEFARALDIDVKSVEYLVMSRATMFADSEVTGPDVPDLMVPVVAAALLNGIALGVEFWRLRDDAGGDAKLALFKLLDDIGITP